MQANRPQGKASLRAMPDRVVTVASLDLRMSPRRWDFADAERARIDAHWRAVVARQPALWNGRILMCSDAWVDRDCLRVRFFETDYASFVAWRDWGWPDRTVGNCFGSAVIRSSDGALVYGRMAPQTLNPGLVYPPGGSLEPGDVGGDGRVDILASIARELREETGLDAARAEPGDLFAVFDGGRLSVAQVLNFGQTADDLAARIEHHRASETEPELAGAVVLRSTAEIDPAMPGYAAQIVRHLLD